MTKGENDPMGEIRQRFEVSFVVRVVRTSSKEAQWGANTERSFMTGTFWGEDLRAIKKPRTTFYHELSRTLGPRRGFSNGSGKKNRRTARSQGIDKKRSD